MKKFFIYAVFGACVFSDCLCSQAPDHSGSDYSARLLSASGRGSRGRALSDAGRPLSDLPARPRDPSGHASAASQGSLSEDGNSASAEDNGMLSEGEESAEVDNGRAFIEDFSRGFGMSTDDRGTHTFAMLGTKTVVRNFARDFSTWRQALRDAFPGDNQVGSDFGLNFEEGIPAYFADFCAYIFKAVEYIQSHRSAAGRNLLDLQYMSRLNMASSDIGSFSDFGTKDIARRFSRDVNALQYKVSQYLEGTQPRIAPCFANVVAYISRNFDTISAILERATADRNSDNVEDVRGVSDLNVSSSDMSSSSVSAVRSE